MSVTDDDLRHHDKEEEAVGDDDDVTVRVLLADVKSLREARNNNDETKVNGEHHHKDLVQDLDNDDKDCGDMALDCMRQTARDACTKKQLLRKVPVLDWLPKYDLQKGVSDLIAGITVGLTVIPQGIAYAIVAELPPQYGLYSAFMGCFIYCIFGSSKDITVGPTAIMALMTAEHVKSKGEGDEGADFAVLLAFLSGCIILIFGILRLGFVIDFISVPVIAGFTSAAAITIASSQVKGLFGLTLAGKNESHVEGITGTWIDIVRSFDTIRYQDTILGLVCVVILLLMRELKTVKWFDPIDEDDTTPPSRIRVACNGLSPMKRKILSKTVWVISTARNAIVVIICLGIAYGCDPDLPDEATRNTTFILTGKIESGLPPFELPPFSTSFHDQTLKFGGMLKELGSAIIIIPLIAILENVAIAKAFAGGKPVDASQEMIALGFCNLAGSFVSSMPTTGSFSRTAVNAASGVQTTFGGIYTGVLVILALAVMMPACAYIPKATLAAVIITAVIFSVEYEVIKPMWRSKKSDLFVAFTSFLCCLFWALEYGILVGVGVQVAFVLYNTARPNMHVEDEQLNGAGTDYIIIRMDRALLFPSVSYVRNLINKVGIRQGQCRVPIVIDCLHIFTSDYTGAKGFMAMAADFRRRGQTILFINVKASVEATMLGPGGHDMIIAHTEEELRQRLEDVFLSQAEEGVRDHLPTSQTVDPLIDNEDFAGDEDDNSSKDEPNA